METMVKKIKQYVGITLRFAVGNEGQLTIDDVNFLIQEFTLARAIKTASKIGKERSYGEVSLHGDFMQYVGIDDIYRVAGPLGHGAMMGQTSKFSYKNIEKVKKVLGNHKDYIIYEKDFDPPVDNLYIAKFVYFLGAPIPYISRRALVCLGIVKSPDKNKVVDEAIKLAESSEFKRKITLRDYEERFSSDFLQFVDIYNISPVFEKLKVGNCFLGMYKRIRSLKDIQREKDALPDPKKFKGFFA